jgi:DNA polymerase-3 subunit alpha
VLIDLSDSSGQFSASCFEDGVAAQLAEWAKESACLLLSVEMDMRPGEELPRFAIRSAKPLDGLYSATRLKMQMEVAKPEALSLLAELLAPLHGGKSELVVKTPISNGKFAHIVLGRRFKLDAEIADKMRAIDGVQNVELAPLGFVPLSVVH